MAATNGRYYLIGNYDYYDNIAHYRIDRIQKIELLDTPVKPISALKDGEQGLFLPKHMIEHIYMFGGESGMVSFRAKKFILSDIIDWFGTDIRLYDEDDEEVSISLRVNHRAMQYWAMQYASHVTVLSPPSLVKKVGEELVRAAQKYLNDVN
jgi:predicted DNA-binding transcriptional regulator YafY